MKQRYALITTVAAIMGIAVLLLVGVSPAGAVTKPVPQSGVQPHSTAAQPIFPAYRVPPMPTYNAPLATWQAWAKQQREFTRSVNYSALAKSHGKVIVGQVDYIPVYRIPGMTPPGVTLLAESDVEMPAPSSSNITAVTTSGDPNKCDTSFGGPGTGCIGAFTSGGDRIAASYTYEGSGAALGHVMLGESGVTNPECPGSAVANGGNVDLATAGAEQIVRLWNVNFSAYWSSTWWEWHGGNNYSNWGNVCADY